METLSAVVAHHASVRPSHIAFVEAGSGRSMTWAQYDRAADELARFLAGRYPRGERVAVQMPDGPGVHVTYLALERAGLIGVGIGHRAGPREVEHLMGRTGARELITTLPNALGHRTAGAVPPERAFGADELWFLNSTSGTTGLPKCVMHHQRRWFEFHRMAVAAADLNRLDVFMSVLPAPFGFGLWTAHFTPTILGAPCVVLERFSAEAVLAAIETHKVSVLAAVSTQFVMMLNSPAIESHDLSSLRVLFTGGEMVPAERARQFEERTGCRVLQFYGSNETGALSRTTLRDSADVRLRTAGRVIDEMHVRLIDPATGEDVTACGGPGVAACKGPVNCLGYYDDPEANAQLFTPDGWMLTGDLCTIDKGVLTVGGRTSDFIIRGGKNISAAQVEAEVSTYPGVALVAAVAVPDAVFGERVCVFCALAPGAVAFTLDDLRAHLQARCVGKELWPEYLVLVDGDLPRSSGGKVAKADLRERAAALPRPEQ